MAMKKVILGAAMLAAVVWFVQPYFAVYGIARAINSGDTVKLDQQVDWPSVRQGIKDDLNAVFARESKDRLKDNPFAGLALTLVPAMINNAVDAYVTPSNFGALLTQRGSKLQHNLQVTGQARQGVPDASSERGHQQLEIKNFKYAFFTGPTSFLVELGDAEGKEDARLKIAMQFRELGWIVTRVYLPVEKLADEPPGGNNLKGVPSNESAPVKSDNNTAESERSAYIEKVKLYDFEARYYESVLDGRIPGVTFKLKNDGDKTLNRVEVTVYFKDAKGNTIAEEKFLPVLVREYAIGDNKPLKPGYIWQIERGKFYTAKSVPSEWGEGSAVAAVTSVDIAAAASDTDVLPKTNQDAKSDESTVAKPKDDLSEPVEVAAPKEPSNQTPGAAPNQQSSEPSKAPVSNEAPTKWSSQKDVSPLDRSPRVILTNLSETTSDTGVSPAAMLALRCMEGQTSVLLALPRMVIAAGEKVRVDYRIGGNQPETATWSLGGSYKILFSPSGAQSVGLIKKMEQADDFYIRVTPDRGDTLAFSFDLGGLKELIEPLKVACHWDEQTASISTNLDSSAAATEPKSAKSKPIGSTPSPGKQASAALPSSPLPGRWRYTRTCNSSVDGELEINPPYGDKFTGRFESFTFGNGKGQIVDGQIQGNQISFTNVYDGLFPLRERYTGVLVTSSNPPHMEGSYSGPPGGPCKFTAAKM
jgi:type VI secretion system VasI family protein